MTPKIRAPDAPISHPPHFPPASGRVAPSNSMIITNGKLRIEVPLSSEHPEPVPHFSDDSDDDAPKVWPFFKQNTCILDASKKL